MQHHKVKKSKNKIAGQYIYRGIYLSKSSYGGGKPWYVRAAEVGVNCPIGLTEKTRARLLFAIDRALDSK